MGVEVFNLETESENYVANGVVVHNCTLKNKSWWRNIFDQHGLQSHEIVNKEELEAGTPLPDVLVGDGKTKLNLGSHVHMHRHGWINIDQIDLGGFAKQNGYNFLHHDLNNGLPFNPGSVDLIIANHLLECLTHEQSIKLLRECRRVLKPDGAMRLSTVDAWSITQRYMGAFDEKTALQQLAEFDEISPTCASRKTAAGKLHELLNAGHQSTWDQPTIEEVLKDAQFHVELSAFRGESHLRREQFDQIRKETLDINPCLSVYINAYPRIVT